MKYFNFSFLFRSLIGGVILLLGALELLYVVYGFDFSGLSLVTSFSEWLVFLPVLVGYVVFILAPMTLGGYLLYQSYLSENNRLISNKKTVIVAAALISLVVVIFILFLGMFFGSPVVYTNMSDEVLKNTNITQP